MWGVVTGSQPHEDLNGGALLWRWWTVGRRPIAGVSCVPREPRRWRCSVEPPDLTNLRGALGRLRATLLPRRPDCDRRAEAGPAARLAARAAAPAAGALREVRLAPLRSPSRPPLWPSARCSGPFRLLVHVTRILPIFPFPSFPSFLFLSMRVANLFRSQVRGARPRGPAQGQGGGAVPHADRGEEGEGDEEEGGHRR